MVDLSAIAAGLSALENALGVLKVIRSNDFNYEKSELKLQVAEVMTSLADAKVALAEARDRIGALEDELARLKAFRERKFKDVAELYVEADDDDRPFDGPFCSRCADVDRLTVRVIGTIGGRRGEGYCPQCKASYQGTVLPGARSVSKRSPAGGRLSAHQSPVRPMRKSLAWRAMVSLSSFDGTQGLAF